MIAWIGPWYKDIGSNRMYIQFNDLNIIEEKYYHSTAESTFKLL
jgi:hypothetical protein